MSRRVDYGLRFYREVLKLDSLHFGLWADGDPRTLEGMRIAQQRYTEHLLSFIPPETRSVLDVGCGTGSTAAQLIERGLEVTCVSPDPYQEELVRERFDGQVECHLACFEELSTRASYDLILMSESAQYIKVEAGCRRSHALLRPDGHLLVADYFRKTPSRRYYKTCHVASEFLDAARRHGLGLVREEDITQRVLPTLELAGRLYREHVRPAADIALEYVESEMPVVWRAANVLLRGKIRKLRHYVYERFPEKLDPAKFAENVRYVIYLFRRSA